MQPRCGGFFRNAVLHVVPSQCSHRAWAARTKVSVLRTSMACSMQPSGSMPCTRENPKILLRRYRMRTLLMATLPDAKPGPCGRENARQLATLFLNEQDGMIKLLFHFGDGALRSSSVLLFFVVFITLQCVASGVWVSNGQFIPAILSGAAMGKRGDGDEQEGSGFLFASLPRRFNRSRALPDRCFVREAGSYRQQKPTCARTNSVIVMPRRCVSMVRL